MDSRIEQSEHDTVLSLHGDVTVQSAVELKGVLTRELGGGNLTINLAYVTDCDVSLFQLLCAAHRTSLAASRSLKVGDLSPAVSQAISAGGFLRAEGCSGETCPWQKKEGKVA